MGIALLIIIICAFIGSITRQEFALALTAAVFLLPWLYSLLMILLLAVIHHRRTRRAFIRISPREVSVGAQLEASYCEDATAAFNGRMLQLPGILVRCRLSLVTKDGRHLYHMFSPTASSLFTAAWRGAYFSHSSELAVFDVLGFFRLAFRLQSSIRAEDMHAEGTLSESAPSAQLLVSPRPVEEPPVFKARAGDSHTKPDFSFQRTDNFIENRPYVPGDDPRRINWKLFSHGMGLFVREGEREPPPHSNIMIFVDAEYDPLLYSLALARSSIDALCEIALAAALALSESGMDVMIGCSTASPNDSAFQRDAKNFPLALAWPAALSLSGEHNFPPMPADRGVVILALPRSSADASALDRLLKDTAGRSVDLLFICSSDEELAAAETCVTLYNRRPGVKAGIMGTGIGERGPGTRDQGTGVE